MTAIGPGTPLICVRYYPHDHSWWPNFRPAPLTPGALYFCEEVFDRHIRAEAICPWDQCGKTGIKLKGLFTPSGKKAPYCPNLFRPLNDGDTSLVETEKEDDSPLVAQAMNILDEAFENV